MSVDDDYAALFERVPVGWSEVVYAGRRYGLTRSVAAKGRAMSVLAEELGGRDIVSANLYLTGAGAQLRACEMPAAKVVDFLEKFEPVEADPGVTRQAPSCRTRDPAGNAGAGGAGM